MQQHEQFTKGVNADEVRKVERLVDDPELTPFHAYYEAVGAYVIAARMKAAEQEGDDEQDGPSENLD